MLPDRQGPCILHNFSERGSLTIIAYSVKGMMNDREILREIDINVEEYGKIWDL